MCESCGEEWFDADIKLLHYKVGVIKQVDSMKAPLKKVQVQVDQSTNYIQIVTNAKYVKEGDKVVVAMEGAIVPAGSNDGILVKKTSVGGVMSHAILCDGVMLDHNGGSNGILVNLNEFDYQVGDMPPLEKPRK